MIISSAIKFYIEKTGEEVILCGVRHGDIFSQLRLLGFEPKEGYQELCQGFVDNTGMFLTREEAYIHAKNCGQLCERVMKGHESCKSVELYSEDLW